jgi:hypothetical protein
VVQKRVPEFRIGFNQRGKFFPRKTALALGVAGVAWVVALFKPHPVTQQGNRRQRSTLSEASIRIPSQGGDASAGELSDTRFACLHPQALRSG